MTRSAIPLRKPARKSHRVQSRSGACQIPADIALADWIRGCKQLADYNLIAGVNSTQQQTTSDAFGKVIAAVASKDPRTHLRLQRLSGNLFI
jgi:hypothetical protein